MTLEAASCTGSTLRSRYESVRERVAAAAARSGRKADDILIVAVTKNAAPEQIRELLELGHADFGESRVQNLSRRVAMVDEFMARHQTMTPSHPVSLPKKVRWHMIGHLQRNKVRKAVELSSLIHSIDSLRVAEEINEWASKRDESAEVLLQVNASFEKSKNGIALPAARHLADQIDSMMHLRLRGLMTMAAYSEDAEVARGAFERCAECFAEIAKTAVGGRWFNILSMGMTNDFETAIECGANVVRIGTAIFGEADPNAPTDDSADGDDD